jgi:ribonuclease HI
VQKLINIKIAKAYRTVSNYALCIIAGSTPNHVKIKDTSELYEIVRVNRNKNLPINQDKLPKQWVHPAARIITTDSETDDPTPINIYTDGSKSEQGVGSGIAIKRSEIPTVKQMYRIEVMCSNNHEEAFALLKALEYIQTTQINEENKVVTVHTDSMTLDSLNNTNIHTFLIEELRKIMHELETREWKIRFRWVKAHAGTSENKLADKLAK